MGGRAGGLGSGGGWGLEGGVVLGFSRSTERPPDLR
jgi:hypothetical protein